MTIIDASKSKPIEGGASFPLTNRVFRAIWQIVWAVLASWTPPPLHLWRNFLLRCFGAKLDPSARIYGSVNVWYPPHLTMGAHAVLGPGVKCYCQGAIMIGERAVVSQGSHLCAGTHDISDPNFQLVIKPIAVGAGAWIAADAFIGPGVKVGEGAVIGARTVLFKDAERFGVYVGNPAKLIKFREIR